MPAALIVPIAALAAYYDVRWRRVPNWLAGGFAVLALVAHATSGGRTGLVASTSGLGVALAVLFPLFALRALGAGDVKFVAALGAAVTLPLVPRLLLLTTLVAAVIAVGDLVRRRMLWRTLAGLPRALHGIPGIDSAHALLVPFTLASAVAACWLLLGAGRP